MPSKTTGYALIFNRDLIGMKVFRRTAVSGKRLYRFCDNFVYLIVKQNVIISDPNILGGTPVFKGTRVPIQNLFDWLETDTIEDFLENFPSVKKEQALEVLKLAEQLIIVLNSPDNRFLTLTPYIEK